MQDNGGERELVLGNRQLLAIFFVAALLCGVFFAVGYVVGGNSAKSGMAVAAADSGSAPTTDGQREEPRQPPTAETPPSIAVTPAADTGGTLPAAEPRLADNPAASGSLPLAPATPAPTQYVQSPPAVKPAASVSTSAAATGIFISVPEKGASYVQVIATPRPHADDLVKSLREARLPAILAESPKPDLFEVLVGPYRTPIAVAEAKRKLTELGFNQLFVHKQ